MQLLSDLGPIAQLRAGRLPRRLVQLYAGLLLYGASLAMIVRAGLGAAPWDVLHLGVTRHLPLSPGQVLILTSVAVLVLWIPLREVPGLGTVSNAVVIGLAADATLAVLGDLDHLAVRVAVMVAAVLLNGVATAAYIGAQLGRGPRDGLMTGLHRRTGLSIRLVRTSLEVTVVVVGLLLGGTAGLGTVVYALAIGPVTQALLPVFVVTLAAEESGVNPREVTCEPGPVPN